MRKGRERSKCYYILLFCEIVCSVFILYEIKMENKKKTIFVWNWEKNIFWHWEWSRILAPKSGDREPC